MFDLAEEINVLYYKSNFFNNAYCEEFRQYMEQCDIFYDEDYKIHIKCLTNHDDEEVKKRKSIEPEIADINKLFYEETWCRFMLIWIKFHSYLM